jgi:hypothetical protein
MDYRKYNFFAIWNFCTELAVVDKGHACSEVSGEFNPHSSSLEEILPRSSRTPSEVC